MQHMFLFIDYPHSFIFCMLGEQIHMDIYGPILILESYMKKP